MRFAHLNPWGHARQLIWNDLKIQCPCNLIAVLRLIEIEGHDVGVAIAQPATEHFNQGRMHKRSFKEAKLRSSPVLRAFHSQSGQVGGKLKQESGA
jgi:hypothetical protein